MVAGVAPGLDFDFAHLPDGKDFSLLVAKACALLDDGASAISLLMDDIDTDFEQRRGDFQSEGQAHAALANALALSLSADAAQGIWVTPRIYADELIVEASDYLPQFIQTLNEHHVVLYCGSDVVARTLGTSSLNNLRLSNHNEATSELLKHRVVLWDNIYANDYCPRRLFVGPWQGRDKVSDVLLNPTGMVHTDCLLLEMMADGLQQPASDVGEACVTAFTVAMYLEKTRRARCFFLAGTVFQSSDVQCTGQRTSRLSDDDAPDVPDVPDMTLALQDAIEECLWRWKSPLSREWYAAIFGLKHDLLALRGEHSAVRIRKTQTSPLASLLTKGRGTAD